MVNLDQLKSQLSSRPEIKSWAITQEHLHRRERYFLLDQSALGVDQDRDTRGTSTYVKIAVKLDRQGRQGEIMKKLSPAFPLAAQIDAAIAAARETDHQEWAMSKEVPSKLPTLKSADPKISEDLEGAVERLTQEIKIAVAKKRATVFNSSELFVSVHHRELHLSNGLIHRDSQTRVYAEAAYSFERKLASGEIRSDEYLSTQWAVALEDLSIQKLFDETSDRAERSLDTIKPQTGKYPVIVDSEVLAQVLCAYVPHLSAMNRYQNLPFLKPGDNFIPAAVGGADGDLMSLSLDPTLDFGADTVAVSEQGVFQRPLDLVKDNRVLATTADRQYSQYVEMEPTTVRGTLVVAPGKLSHAELSKSQPEVLEILQFSGLFVDPTSGTFSSEIRLARLYDNRSGQVSYVKGGSLSGSITENFKQVRLSKNRVRTSHFSPDHTHGRGYYGPDFALLSDVSIVG